MRYAMQSHPVSLSLLVERLQQILEDQKNLRLSQM